MRSARPGRRLLAVVAVTALVLAGAGAALAWEGYQDARAAELEEVADGARASVADVGQFLRGREDLLLALAENEGIVRGDPEAADDRLESLELGDLGFTAGIALLDVRDRVVAAAGPAMPSAAPEPRLARALARARATDAPFLSEALPPSIFAETAVVIALPVSDARGRTSGTLAAAMGLSWLNGVAARLSAARGGTTDIVDRAGQLIVAPGFAGVTRVGDDPLLARARSLPPPGDGLVRTDAIADARAVDGRLDQLVGFAYEPDRTGWSFFITRDADAALSGARRTLWLQLGGLALLVLAGVAGAALVARRLDRLSGERDALLDSARRAEGRSAFLARAATALDQEPRLAGRLQRLADLCVPDLGDRCVVELAAQDGEPARTAVAPPGGPPDGRAVRPVAAPLLVGGRRIGSIAISRGGGGPAAEDDQAALAERLAGQAALQLESARLYEREHEIAGILQRSLLPDALPAVPGIALAARYLPAGAAVEAGGDWYEAVNLGGGRLALAVGDVVGKGARAAAAMGRLRSALRAFAMEGLGPAELLARLSRFAETVPEAACATVAVALVGADDAEARYACAGHPYPLLLPSGAPARLLEDGRGGPLAGWAGVRFTEGQVRLEEGDALALYTDGLVERREAGIDAGLARLTAAAEPLRGAPVEAICAGLLSALGAESAPDDVALLVARRESAR